MQGIELGRGIGQGLPRQGLGGFGTCRCPSCGYINNHIRSTPCNRIRCPNCGIKMVGN